jgi:hypothetical protein
VDNVAVGEVQSLNAADGGLLTAFAEADSGDARERCGNRDTRAGTISLIVEVDRIVDAAAELWSSSRPTVRMLEPAAIVTRFSSS